MYDFFSRIKMGYGDDGTIGWWSSGLLVYFIGTLQKLQKSKVQSSLFYFRDQKLNGFSITGVLSIRIIFMYQSRYVSYCRLVSYVQYSVYDTCICFCDSLLFVRCSFEISFLVLCSIVLMFWNSMNITYLVPGIICGYGVQVCLCFLLLFAFTGIIVGGYNCALCVLMFLALPSYQVLSSLFFRFLIFLVF